MSFFPGQFPNLSRRPMTKRLYTMTHLGFRRTIEEYIGPEEKRVEPPKKIIAGDGFSSVHYVQDPANGCELVTVRMITHSLDPYVAEVRKAYGRHLDNPASAEPAIIRAHLDNGTVLPGQLTLVRASIQNVKYPEGNTGTHENSMLEITFQPAEILPG